MTDCTVPKEAPGGAYQPFVVKGDYDGNLSVPTGVQDRRAYERKRVVHVNNVELTLPQYESKVVICFAIPNSSDR